MKNLFTLICFSLAFLFITSMNAFSQTNFYSQGNLDINDSTSWNSERDGSGTQPSFATANQIFNVQNGHLMTASATLSIAGNGRRMNIETGGQITSGLFNHAMTLDMEADGTYIISFSYTNLTMGTQDPASIFQLNSTNFRPTLVYPTLICNNSTTLTFSSTTINGDLIIIGSGEVRGAAAVDQSYSIGGSLIINGGTFAGSNGAGNSAFTIDESLLLISGTFRPSTTTGRPTFTFTGNNGSIDLSGGTLTNNNYHIVMDGTRSLLSNFTVTESITFNNNGILEIGENTLTLNGPINFNGGSIRGQSNVGLLTSNANLIINGSGAVTGNFNFSAPAVFNNITSNRNITLATNLNIRGDLTLNDAVLILNGKAVTLKGGLTRNGTSGITGDANARFRILGPGPEITLPAMGNLFELAITRDAQINIDGATTIYKFLNLNEGTVTSAGNLTLKNSCIINRIDGSVDSAPTLVNGFITEVNYAGTNPVNSTPELAVERVLRLAINNPAGVTLSESPLLGFNKITINDGFLNMTDNFIMLAGPQTEVIENGGYLTGSTGTITADLRIQSPAAQNIAGLGFTITSPNKFLGTFIDRDWEAVTINGDPGINRTYEIKPGRNAKVNGEVTVNYREDELNNNIESTLKLYYSEDNTAWTEVLNQNLDTDNNRITTTGVGRIAGFYTIKGDQADNPIANKRSEGKTETEKIVTDIPSETGISQNYPNPFNPVTQIRFALPESDFVTVKVFDITGREIAELVSGQMNAGYHTVQFNGSNLSSGIYFYRITTASGFEKVMRMSLIK
jgi:hypothetical protein